MNVWLSPAVVEVGKPATIKWVAAPAITTWLTVFELLGR